MNHFYIVDRRKIQIMIMTRQFRLGEDDCFPQTTCRNRDCAVEYDAFIRTCLFLFQMPLLFSSLAPERTLPSHEIFEVFFRNPDLE